MSLPDGFSSTGARPSGRFTRRHSFIMPFQPLPTPHVRHSDLAVVTWVAGDAGYKWFSVTGPAMKHYADRVGADLIVLEGFGSQPYYLANKFRVRQVFDEYGYQSVLYVDGDILLKHDCENFFEVVPDGHLGILDESLFYDYWMLAHYRHEAAELLESQGLDPRHYKIPTPKNAGFYLMPHEHSRALQAFTKPFPLCYRNGATVEQTWFCLMIEHHSVPIYHLRFPQQHWLWYLDQRERMTDKSSVLHFCGMTDAEKRFHRLAANASKWLDSATKEPTESVMRSVPPFDAQMLLDHEAEAALKLKDNFTITSHQYGWDVALKALSVLYNPDGILFDGFVEKTFLWDLEKNRRDARVPYRQPWIGVIHHPPGIPQWPSLAHHRIQELERVPEWQQSLRHCIGLIALSEYLANWTRKRWGVHCEVLRYPALRPENVFSPEKFGIGEPRTVAMIGFWLRRYSSFERLEAGSYRKLRPLLVEDPNSAGMDHVRVYEKEEARAAGNSKRTYGEVEIVTRRSNSDYDELLSKCVVFLDLIDASAVTTVVECLARCTPLLVNRLPALEEYLGVDYPLFYETLDEAGAKLRDISIVLAGHQHMRENPIRQRLQPQRFLDEFVQTRSYQRALWQLAIA
jgi:lipopolysaccharide biosynthesis glycosyltransferase